MRPLSRPSNSTNIDAPRCILHCSPVQICDRLGGIVVQYVTHATRGCATLIRNEELAALAPHVRRALLAGQDKAWTAGTAASRPRVAPAGAAHIARPQDEA